MNKTGQHIAIVSNTSWSIYNFRLGLIRALINAGHHVYAVAPRDDYSDNLTSAGATYIPLKMGAHATSPLEDLKTTITLYRIYKQLPLDQILHYTIKLNIYGSIAARMLHIPSYALVTGLGRTFQFVGLSQKIVKSLYQVALRCSREVWFLNAEDRERFISEGLISKDKTFILPSEGVNTFKFRGTPLPPIGHRLTRFLFAGRLLKDKGILEYVAAARHILQTNRRIKFEVLGFVNPDNPMSVTLKDLEEWQRSGWINYLGSHEDIRPFINRSDCIVFPSYYQEGVSRILLEAASMSRPIITTDQVGCRDVVDHNHNGLLVAPGSVPDLIDGMKTFLDTSEEDRITMGNLGRKKVKRQFDEQSVIDIYFEKLSLSGRFTDRAKTKKQINEH